MVVRTRDLGSLTTIQRVTVGLDTPIHSMRVHSNELEYTYAYGLGSRNAVSTATDPSGLKELGESVVTVLLYHVMGSAARVSCGQPEVVRSGWSGSVA